MYSILNLLNVILRIVVIIYNFLLNRMFVQFLLEVISDLEEISPDELKDLPNYLLPIFTSFTAKYPCSVKS
jgi:hypothetical protein